jgi:hypothetical protein
VRGADVRRGAGASEPVPGEGLGDPAGPGAGHGIGTVVELAQALQVVRLGLLQTPVAPLHLLAQLRIGELLQRPEVHASMIPRPRLQIPLSTTVSRKPRNPQTHSVTAQGAGREGREGREEGRTGR